MSALLVGLVFGLIVVLGGAGIARHLDPDQPSVPAGTAAFLAGFVMLVGDASTLIGFTPGMALILGGMIAAAGWVWPHKIRLTDLAARLLNHPRVALLLAVAALALLAPLLVLPVPLDTDAQGFGYLSLMMREGGRINTLAPWHPGIAYLYSPGALLVFATLSGVVKAVPMSAIMMGASHVIAVLFVWLAWEFGREIGHSVAAASGLSATDSQPGRDRWGGAMSISAALSVGLWTALMDAHYTVMLALLFTLACLTNLFRYLRTTRLVDALLTALMLSAVLMTQPDMTIILALGLGAFSLLSWLAVDRLTLRRWLVVSVGIPIVAALLASPWLVSIWPLVNTGIESPFGSLLSNWRVAIFYHGLIWPILALIGAGVYLRTRQAWALMMIGWLVLAFEFSIVGVLPRIFPVLAASLQRFGFPFSMAWHAPIIPYMSLGTGALVWIGGGIEQRFEFDKLTVPAAIMVAVGILLAVFFSNRLLAFSKSSAGPYGAFASRNDLLAMRWLRDHTPPDVRILNYPGDYKHLRDWEGHWAPVLTERDCVYFRMQPFFLDAAGRENSLSSAYAEQAEFLYFWRDPANEVYADLLTAAGIDYVLVPDAVGDPASLAQSWRWQPPALLPNTRSTPADASYLRLVYSAGGAQVYQVQP